MVTSHDVLFSPHNSLMKYFVPFLWIRKRGFRDVGQLPKVMLVECWSEKFSSGESDLLPARSAFQCTFAESIY